MVYNYLPSGVCSRSITIDIDENDVIQSVTFFGGCNGNLKGISALVTGLKADDVIEKLKEIVCPPYKRNKDCACNPCSLCNSSIFKIHPLK